VAERGEWGHQCVYHERLSTAGAWEANDAVFNP